MTNQDKTQVSQKQATLALRLGAASFISGIVFSILTSGFDIKEVLRNPIFIVGLVFFISVVIPVAQIRNREKSQEE